MAVRTYLPDPVPEKSTLRYTAVARDETGTAIAGSSLFSMTLTLFEAASLAIVNGVSAVNILNTGRGSVDASGNLVITLLPADNQILDTAKAAERHVMLIEFTWAGGAKAGRHEVEFSVVNMALVT